MLQYSALLLCAGLFVFALSCFVYVSYRFLTIALGIDAAILRGLSNLSVATRPADAPTVKGPVDIVEKSDGEYIPYSEEEAFINEKVESLRREGLTDEELASFIRQAVGTDIGSPDKQ